MCLGIQKYLLINEKVNRYITCDSHVLSCLNKLEEIFSKLKFFQFFNQPTPYYSRYKWSNNSFSPLHPKEISELWASSVLEG